MLGGLASASGDWAAEDEAEAASTKAAMGAESALRVQDMEGV